jgi:hypothetical protein
VNKDTWYMIERLKASGITETDALALRRVAMTLHSWHERECGTDNGCIERDETTGKAYWLNSHTMRRSPIADRETGALKRLTAIMDRYPDRFAYVQGDPRGAALYIVSHADVPDGADVDSYYSRGIAVYK